jgi:uncharacterized protein YxjI
MRYTLRHKLISLGGDSSIKDDAGRELYRVDGKLVSIGRRLVIKDSHGRRAATIQRRLIAFTPTFEVSVAGGQRATVSLKWLTLLDRLKIDVPGWKDLEARGDLLHHEYGIFRGSKEVARISKHWISLTDAYGVQIDDDQDQVLLLGCAVVIDEILELREREQRKD